MLRKLMFLTKCVSMKNVYVLLLGEEHQTQCRVLPRLFGNDILFVLKNSTICFCTLNLIRIISNIGAESNFQTEILNNL